MAQSSNSEWQKRNALLRRLQPESFERLVPMLEPVTLGDRQVLYHPGQKVTDIYFPDTAILCMLTIMEDGRTIEAVTVGQEGASWISASVGTPPMPCQTMAAVGGRAYKVAARELEAEIRRNGLAHDLFSEYAHALLISSLRTGACNGLHSHTERAARWMLNTLDRTGGQQFTITQDFLASLLGCQRTTLNHIMMELTQLGAVENRRGSIVVINRIPLEKAACECYASIRKVFEDLEHREDRLLR